MARPVCFSCAFASGTRTVHANTDFTEWATGVPLVLRRDVATGPLHVDTAEAFVRQGKGDRASGRHFADDGCSFPWRRVIHVVHDLSLIHISEPTRLLS